ncbi:MAG: hypothetical protein JNL12_20515 [Planctomycetes bacterium]|nr:hypothetical protein [Planctomycetota bacterium]
MSEPIESVARVASTPSEAKIFVAMLRAEGIPARTDGDSLVDEFAASQRLMNLVGTKVIVPTSSLARAREILQPEPVDPVELERAALAASPEPTPLRRPAAAANASSSRLLLALLVLAIGAAVLFAFLWRNSKAPEMSASPDLEYRWDGESLAETRSNRGGLLRLCFDRDHDGRFEVQELYEKGARRVAVLDRYHEGIYLRTVESRGDGLTATWTDEDRDGLYDAGVVTDATGKVLQELRWRAGKGFEVQTK